MQRFQKTVLAVSVLAALLMLGATTIVNLATQVTGILPCGSHPVLTGNVTTSSGSCATTIANTVVTNAMLASGSYAQGVFYAACTGTAVVGATTNFDFIGYGDSATSPICSTALTTSAGGMPMPTSGTVKNLRVNLGTAGKSGDNIKLLKNGSATGAPTCTYGVATTCNDVATALTVAAGDVITISNSTSASETAANISVSFELWN